MATWNSDKPAVGNQISEDIPDIEENFQELHDVITAITNGTLGTTEPANFQVDVLGTPAIWGEQRSQFVYKDTDEIYINPGCYHHVGTVSQYVYWNSQLTLDIGSPDASDWYYVYIDDSAVVSAGTNLLTASEFIFSNTEPSWSNAKHGWYNGDDRCIFAVYSNASSNIFEFFHDGGNCVLYPDFVADLSATDVDTAWTDVTLTIPKFSTNAEITIITSYVDGATTSYWRTNGQSGTTGLACGYIASAGESYNTLRVNTDTSQKIEVRNSASNGNTIAVYTSGFYLPTGI